MSRDNPTNEPLSGDLIWGVGGVNGLAAELGIPPQRAYYLIPQGKLPVAKLGHRTLVASRKQLRRLIEIS